MRWSYRIAQFGCQAVFLAAYRARAIGLQNVPATGGVLLVSNHQSYFDPVIVAAPIPREVHFMARDSLFRDPRFARLIAHYNAFPVKRGTADLGAIKESLRRLKAGAVVTAFPEGTRTTDGGILPMHAGIVLLARRAATPIVPTLILGAFEAWHRARRLPRLLPVLVAYGKPISPGQCAQLSDEECITLVRGRIVDMARRYHRHPALGPNRAALEYA